MGMPFLGELALNPEVRVAGDSGFPVAAREGDDPNAAPFLELAQRIEAACRDAAVAAPTMTIED